MKQIGRNHRNVSFENGINGGMITDEMLIDWYSNKLKPHGSGPVFLMRLACALIEEIAETRGIDLSTK